MKYWYFERDYPFCTRSASSFCCNPIYFLAHAMWVKWWSHAMLEPYQNSFQMLFNFMVLKLKIISKCMKKTNEVRKNWKMMMWLWMVHYEHIQKSGVQICFEKWNPFVTDEFPDEILILWKRLSVWYTKCIQFLP